MIDDATFRNGLPRNRELARIAGEAMEAVLERFPFWASDLGLHQWDDQLPRMDAAARSTFERKLAGFRADLARVASDSLDLEDWADWQTLRHNLELLWDDETEYRPYTLDPNLYNQAVSSSLLTLARRNFHTPQDRARSAISRLEQVPELLDSARQLLLHPPLVYTETAIVQFEQTLPFLEEMLPEAFTSAGSDLAARVSQSAHRAGEAYRRFVHFLRDDLLGRSDGDFRLGSERYRNRLLWQEGIEEPVSALLDRGYEELNRLQSKFDATARELGADSGVDLLKRLGADHPPADRLLEEIRGSLDRLKHFCLDRDLVTIPSVPDPMVVETPAFMRMITFASIDPPGPFENEAKEAYYQVTLPDPLWDPKDIDAHLAGFNRFAALVISAHEVFPGHFVQFLHLPRARSTVRKVFGSGAFIEGWAHYTEELMVEEGYGGAGPDGLKLQLMQIMEALERVGRLIVGIRLHTEAMTVEEAAAFFVNECYMEPVNARREALRGTMDPFYLIYTLGKLELLRMREKARRTWGQTFSLKTFHDRVLEHGFPTMPVLERLLFEPATNPLG